MESIGLIAAMPQESEALLRHIRVRERATLGPFIGCRFLLGEENYLLVKSGIGLKRAVDATHALLSAASPRLLVSFGVAGAVEDDLQIGDVIVASKCCLLEEGVPGQFLPLASLTETAWKAAAQALRPHGARLFLGTTITTRGSQAVRLKSQEIPHPILEMETAGIARLAAEKGIPLLALRAVSDGPRAPIPFDLAAMTDEEYNIRLGRIIQAALRRPRIILQSLQLVRNVAKASENAAIALVAILEQSCPVVSP